MRTIGTMPLCARVKMPCSAEVWVATASVSRVRLVVLTAIAPLAVLCAIPESVAPTTRAQSVVASRCPYSLPIILNACSANGVDCWLQ